MFDPWLAASKGLGDFGSRPANPSSYSLLSPAVHTDKSRFSEKVAVSQQFDGVNNGSTWKMFIRNYLVSRAMEMDHLLRLVKTGSIILEYTNYPGKLGDSST